MVKICLPTLNHFSAIIRLGVGTPHPMVKGRDIVEGITKQRLEKLIGKAEFLGICFIDGDRQGEIINDTA